ncbi:NACHT domain-containing protein [Streptomyces sp. SID7815]|uniref:NACHT domain-containing protein n=1 Tax=Streptomyces sp. SID7815 TaxID=2690332 RepID=UPI00131A316B|nr:NACHT domain-containing protein [Streptomyces sp. SID7815]MYT50145.1 NACHT domain-containing protein [Streptomyces sp. SID7815]
MRDAVGQLARHSRRYGMEQEKRRGVLTPPPIQVRFTTAPEDLVAQLANILGTRLDGVPEPLELDGRLDEIANVYRRTSGQLVILGERGSGKSVVAQRLALELLESRRPDQDPVPVVFALHDWDPATELRDWLAARLVRDNNGLDITDSSGVSLAEALLDDGLILPVLDGFDEVSPGLQTAALRKLSDTAMPLLLTSVTDAYVRAVRGSRTLARAAVVVLGSLTPDDIRLYLPRTAPTRSSAAEWESALALASASKGDLAATPVGQALSTPLMVGLARVIYSDGPHDPKELLDTKRFATASAMETHLLEQFVPAVYEQRQRWRAGDASRWLGYLAQRPGGRDIAWWTLADSVPRCQRALAFALPAMFLGALTGHLAYGGAGGLVGSALLLLGALIGWSNSPVPARLALRVSGRARYALAQLVVGPVGGLTVALIGYPAVQHWGWLALAPAGGAGSALGNLLSNRARHRDPDEGNRPLRLDVGLGVVGGSVGGLAVGCACLLAHVPPSKGSYGAWLILGGVIGLAFAMGAVALAPAGVDHAVTPRALLRSNRQYAIFQTLTVGIAYGLVAGALTDPVKGIIVGTAIGIAFGVGAHAWGRWLIVVRFWLPLTGRLPWRVWGFLADAHQRDILRQAGAVYEFRHARLQDNLAARYHAAHPRGLRVRADISAAEVPLQ